MENISCKDCLYFKKHIYRDQKGECRRHTPIWVEGYSNSVWPDVEADDWCGEFKSKNAKLSICETTNDNNL